MLTEVKTAFHVFYLALTELKLAESVSLPKRRKNRFIDKIPAGVKCMNEVFLAISQNLFHSDALLRGGLGSSGSVGPHPSSRGVRNVTIFPRFCEIT